MPQFNAQSFALLVEPFLSSRRWIIAYSGGIDSHVLLHAVATLPAAPPLLALHVNHGLQAQANRWQAHCAQVCAKLNVPFLATAVDVDDASRGGLEDAARRARYGAFESELQHDELLLLAHHADDQIETILLRLLRGAGTAGLAGMPARRSLGNGSLVRPLLTFCKYDLQRYAELHALRHVDDNSNLDTSLDRNYLRRNVLPLLEKRWPQYRQSWLQSANWLAESADIDAALGAQDLTALDWQAETPGGSLCLSALCALSSTRAKNAVRHACLRLGLRPPPQQQLRKLLTELPAAKAGAQPQITWADGEARRFAGRLFVLPRLESVDNTTEYHWSGEDLTIPGAGILRTETAAEPGLARGEQYCVRWRRGGETFTPRPGGQRKALKKWLQEAGVPPWVRDRTPLIYKNDDLVAIGDMWVAQAHCKPQGAMKIRFERTQCKVYRT